MGTFKDKNSEIDEDAVNIVESILRGENWSRCKPQPDKVGLDMRVDYLEKHHPQISFYLQIKGMGTRTRRGKILPIISRTGTVDKVVELEHLDYYTKLPVPVFLVAVDTVTKSAYYLHVQRYVHDVLKHDDWRQRLHSYQSVREAGRSSTPPTKILKIPAKNVLSDTDRFMDVVRDAKGLMASLAVPEGIAYMEESLRRLDERFMVTLFRDGNGERFQIDAKESVEMKLHARMPKEKFEALFRRGLPVDINPGELRFEGSPLWESIYAEPGSFQMKQKRRGFINLLRLDGADQPVARLECLACAIEGGYDEWRLKFRLPNDLMTIVITLDMRVIRDHAERKLAAGSLNTTFSYRSNLENLQGKRLMSIPFSHPAPSAFYRVADDTRFRIDLVVEGIGKLGNFTLGNDVNDVFAGIGTLHEAIRKARAIAKFFKIDPLIPDHFQDDDFDQIDFLFDLIQGGDIPNPHRFGEIDVTVKRESMLAALNANSSWDISFISMQSEANFSFLGENIYIANVAHSITNIKVTTKISDIQQRLQSSLDDIPIHVVTTNESTQTVQIVDISKVIAEMISSRIESS